MAVKKITQAQKNKGMIAALKARGITDVSQLELALNKAATLTKPNKEQEVGASFAEASRICKTMAGYHVVRHPVHRDKFTCAKNKAVTPKVNT